MLQHSYPEHLIGRNGIAVNMKIVYLHTYAIMQLQRATLSIHLRGFKSQLISPLHIEEMSTS
jgi:hypothetical protein